MKGLLIKDLKLLKLQRITVLFVLIMTIGINVFMEDATFIIWYLMFMGAIMVLGTFNYDEFDNGSAFLFSLPVTRKIYVVEKYGLALIVSGISLLAGMLILIIVGFVRNTISVTDIMPIVLINLAFMLLVLAVMIPFKLKFGGEKGSIVIIVAMLFIIAIGFVIVKLADATHIDLISILDNLLTMNMGVLAAAVIVIAAGLLLLSCKISIAIMDKKEF